MKKCLIAFGMTLIFCFSFSSGLAHSAEKQSIMAALLENDNHALKLALASDANINEMDSQGHTALDYALTHVQSWAAPDAVALLLQHGARPGSGPAGMSLAIARLAVTNAPLEELEKVLASGGNANARDMPNGFTAFLWAAARTAEPAFLERLIRAGADPLQTLAPNELTHSQPGDNALLLAARYNSWPEIIRTLLRFGLDVNSRSAFLGDSALMRACCYNSNPAVAEALIKAGADVNLCNGVSSTAFLFAARRADGTEIVRLLAQQKADVLATDDAGFNALHEATGWNGGPTTIRLLLSLGLPVNAVTADDADKNSALMLAVRHTTPNAEVIRLLLQHGADVKLHDAGGKQAGDDLSPERIAWLKENNLESILTSNGKYTDHLKIHDVTEEILHNNLINIKGKIVKAVDYTDATGDNVVLITETKEQRKQVDQYGTVARSKELYAYRLLANQAGSPEPVWRVTDSVRDCTEDMIAKFMPEALRITDLDNNGTAEIWMGYQLDCRGDIGPSTMKIIMYEGGQKYAMRGTTKVNISENETVGGIGTMDNNLINGPAEFRTFADKLWMEYQTKH